MDKVKEILKHNMATLLIAVAIGTAIGYGLIYLIRDEIIQAII